jgi:hypothetical protein
MLQSILGLVDRTIQLLKLRAERRRRFFSESIRPIHKDLARIHEDYIAAFTSIRMRIPLDQTKKRNEFQQSSSMGLIQGHLSLTQTQIAEILKELHSLRMKLDSVRRAVREEVRTLPLHTTYKQEHYYLDAVARYFDHSIADLVSSTQPPSNRNNDTPPSEEALLPAQSSNLTDFRSVQGAIQTVMDLRLQALLLLHDVHDPGKDILDLLDKIVEQRTRRWRMVCKEYANLRATIDTMD